MTLRIAQTLTMKLFVLTWIGFGIGFIFLSRIARAEDLPSFRQGLWEFNRTVETIGSPGKPQTLTTKKCTNPTEDMKKQHELVSKTGCKFSPAVRTGKTYTFTTECNIQGVTTKSTSIMTVENDGAYTVKVESRSGAQGTNETLQARRTGDCAK